MSKNATTKILRLMVSNYNHQNSNILTPQRFNQLNYMIQRNYFDFTGIIKRLKNVIGIVSKKENNNQNKLIDQQEPIQSDLPTSKFSEEQEARLNRIVETKTINYELPLKNPHLQNTVLQNIESKTEYSNKNELQTTNEFAKKAEYLTNEIFENLCKTYPKFKKVRLENAKKNYENLLKNGVYEEFIQQNLELLSQDSYEFETKLSLVSDFGLNINDGILFCGMDLDDLNAFVQTCEKEGIKPVDKIKALCDITQETTQNMCKYFFMYRHLRTGNLPGLKEKLRLLLDEGFELGDIIKDSIILNYKVETIRSRIKAIHDNKIEERTTSIIRKISNQSTSPSKRNTKSKKEKDSSIIDFIAQRINCDKNTAMNLISKNPKLESIKMQKLEEVFNVFDEFNVDTNLLLLWPELFNRRTDLLKNRLMKMKNMGYDVSDNIIYLTKSSKEFEFLLKKSCAQ